MIKYFFCDTLNIKTDPLNIKTDPLNIKTDPLNILQVYCQKSRVKNILLTLCEH